MKTKVFLFGLTVLALSFTSCTETSLEEEGQETQMRYQKKFIDGSEIQPGDV